MMDLIKVAESAFAAEQAKELPAFGAGVITSYSIHYTKLYDCWAFMGVQKN